MKRTFNHTAARYSKDTGGNVALLFAISTFFIIGLLAMAVDLSNSYSGSMGQSVNGQRGGPSKMKGLKTAANGLIDTFDNLNNTDLRLSVVPFAQYINVGKINSKAGWLDFANADQRNWKGCVGSRLNGNDESPTERGGTIPALPGQYCANEILPLTSNMATARRSINNLKPRGWTYIPSGITWGWRTLEGELPKKVAAAPAKDDHKRVMVIMTDGENTRSKLGLTHEGENLNNANRKVSA